MATLRPGLPRFTPDDPANANLVALGFSAVTAGSVMPGTVVLNAANR